MFQAKEIDWLNGYKIKIHIYAVYKRPTSVSSRNSYRLKVREWKKVLHANRKQKTARVAILMSHKVNFKGCYRRQGHYIMIKGSIQEEDITIVNICIQHRSTTI